MQVTEYSPLSVIPTLRFAEGEESALPSWWPTTAAEQIPHPLPHRQAQGSGFGM